MNWGSWSDFWAMGGQAFYVWGSYAVVAALLILEVVLVTARGRQARRLAQQAQELEPGAGKETT